MKLFWDKASFRNVTVKKNFIKEKIVLKKQKRKRMEKYDGNYGCD